MTRLLHRAALLVLLGSAVSQASINEALNALYDGGHNLKSLAADLSLENRDEMGSKTVKTGSFVMQRLADGNNRARVSFTRSQSGKQIFTKPHDYVLDGTELIDRDVESKKQVTRHFKAGEKIDLFKLGEGPFPLPIGQSPADVLANFEVTEEANTDPTVLAVVTLKPKPKTPMADNFRYIRVTIDRQTKLPRVIATSDPKGQEKNTATLTNVRVDDSVKDDDFKLPPIDPKDGEWTLVNSK